MTFSYVSTDRKPRKLQDESKTFATITGPALYIVKWAVMWSEYGPKNPVVNPSARGNSLKSLNFE